MGRHTWLLIVALLALGCAPTIAPSKPTPGPISLRTAESPVTATPCPSTLVEGTLIESVVSGLGLLDESGTKTTEVVWPFEWWASPSIGGSLLVDAAGEVVARTGDRVRVEAVEMEEGAWLVCGRVLRVRSFDP
jgi:hypothetical protein